jgi:hypothetical protein
VCGHFSDNAQGRDADPKYRDFKFSMDDQIIRIHIDQFEDESFFIAFTNLLHRSSGATFEEHMDKIPSEIRSHREQLRNNFFSKINERNIYADLFPKLAYACNENFDFPFMDFYNYNKFCYSLNKLAEWLGKSFMPTGNLYMLWQEFIRKNQGWESFTKCDGIIESILGNQNKKIACTVLEEAWIMYNITKITGVHVEFDEVFPKTTQQIYKLLTK